MSEASEAPRGSPRYAVNRVIYDLANHPEARKMMASKDAFIARYPVTEEEREALLGPDWPHLLTLGALPNLVYKYYMLHGLAPESFPAAIAGRTSR
jgi:hypothetical protein